MTSPHERKKSNKLSVHTKMSRICSMVLSIQTYLIARGLLSLVAFVLAVD